MTRGVLMRTRLCSTCGVMLRCVSRATSALQRVADKVQGAEDAVAEDQSPYEEERQVRLSDRTR